MADLAPKANPENQAGEPAATNRKMPKTPKWMRKAALGIGLVGGVGVTSMESCKKENTNIFIDKRDTIIHTTPPVDTTHHTGGDTTKTGGDTTKTGTPPGGGTTTPPTTTPKVPSTYLHWGEYAEYYGQDASTVNFSGYTTVTADVATWYDASVPVWKAVPSNISGRLDLTGVDPVDPTTHKITNTLQEALVERITARGVDPYLRDSKGGIVIHNGRNMLNVANAVVQSEVVQLGLVDIANRTGGKLSMFGFDNLVYLVGKGVSDNGVSFNTAGLTDGLRNITAGIGLGVAATSTKPAIAGIAPANLIAGDCFYGTSSTNFIANIRTYTPNIQYRTQDAVADKGAIQADIVQAINAKPTVPLNLFEVTQNVTGKKWTLDATLAKPFGQLAVDAANGAAAITTNNVLPAKCSVYIATDPSSATASDVAANKTIGAQVSGQITFAVAQPAVSLAAKATTNAVKPQGNPYAGQQNSRPVNTTTQRGQTQRVTHPTVVNQGQHH